MRALVLRRGDGRGHLGIEDVDEPSPADGELLVAGVALGVCGTDRHLAAHPPRPAPGRDALVLGHESLGRVVEAPAGSGFAAGDLVAGIVRRPDPVPCPSCAAGEFDQCTNGRYTERGITGRDGFGAERYRLEPAYAVRVDESLGLAGVLLEPASIVAKAWERTDRLLATRPARVLVTGAGPIGLLAALLGVQRGHEVHVVDRVASGRKADQARALGAAYHSSVAAVPGRFDAAVECSGALADEAFELTTPSGVLCLVAGRLTAWPASIGNRAVLGTVNSNRRHFEAGHAALLAADRAWLAGLLGPQVGLDGWQQAFAAGPDSIKAVIHLGGRNP